MRIILNNKQILEVNGDPKFRGDPLRFPVNITKEEDIKWPIEGQVRVVDDIVWPGKETSEEFELFSFNADDWLYDKAIDEPEYAEDGETVKVHHWRLEFTNVHPTPVPRPPTPEEQEEERLRLLAEAKANKIAQSKVDLATWIESHPLKWIDGKYYSVTQTKQSQLTGELALYNIAKEKGEEYELKWNSTGEECTVWTIEALSQLALDIGSYVKPLVTYQQAKEVEVNACTVIEDVEAVIIDYSSVWPDPNTETK